MMVREGCIEILIYKFVYGRQIGSCCLPSYAATYGPTASCNDGSSSERCRTRSGYESSSSDGDVGRGQMIVWVLSYVDHVIIGDYSTKCICWSAVDCSVLNHIIHFYLSMIMHEDQDFLFQCLVDFISIAIYYVTNIGIFGNGKSTAMNP